ncbi:MAG: UDP-N-acetylmuramate dehydrogenase [Lachnospiraceae bacterium]|nr:UDP-N-acetylmuramate dehydrogenase [Lachnospiraceae bacterium]
MNIFSDLQTIAGQENIEERVSFRKLTTFKSGGEARCFVSPPSEEALKELLAYLKKNGVPYFLLGRGANVLASDRGFDGVIISLRKHFSGITAEGQRLYAGAGAYMSEAAKAALSASLSGLEFASGIPGTIGGGLFMNTGAYGGELKDVVREVRVLTEDGEIRTFSNEEMGFSYRHSVLSENGAIALRAVLELHPGDDAEILSAMNELSEKRKVKQPLEFASAGSTFKRPEGYYAGALIEAAGLKGFRIGDAGVSEKHAGFVVNYHQATSDDIYRVIRHVQKTVQAQSGVLLEREVRLLGEFEWNL